MKNLLTLSPIALKLASQEINLKSRVITLFCKRLIGIDAFRIGLEDEETSFLRTTWPIIERKPQVNLANSVEGAGKVQQVLSYREY